ncbi:hypothetical protein Btru_067211 [Bulinus truncatus]|nr:hypothetical protein Btru_067211 [Bulinus truncatus]
MSDYPVIAENICMYYYVNTSGFRLIVTPLSWDSRLFGTNLKETKPRSQYLADEPKNKKKRMQTIEFRFSKWGKRAPKSALGWQAGQGLMYSTPLRDHFVMRHIQSRAM